MKNNILIVGAGFAGAIHARELATNNYNVTIIDKRDHISGNCFDYVDASGIRVHRYGPHLFHTSNVKVFEYLSRFTEWVEYEHKVVIKLSDNTHVPLPINIDTINSIFNKSFTNQNEAKDYIQTLRLEKKNILNAEDWLYNKIGEKLTNLFYRPYTKKMWNLDLKEGGIGNDLIQAIRELGLVSNIVLSGLKLTNARDVLMANPDFNVLVNLSKVDQFFVATKLLSRLYIKYRFKALKKEPSVIALNMHHRYASKSIIREVHKLGLEIWVYTVDDTDLFNKLFQEGVDSVTTNSPSEVLNTFRL